MFGNYEYYNQSFNIQPFLIKLKNNELTLENILDEDEIIDDIKFNTDSEFIDFLTKEKIKKLIDYSTKMPESDSHNIGFKYPFNATEILCSENVKFQNKFLEEKPYISKEVQMKKIKEKLDKRNKITKGGFISEFFKILNKVKNNDINMEINFDEKIEVEDLSDEEILECEIDKNSKKEMIYENVDYLLEFLKEPEEVKDNYVLVGYFYKILNSLISIHGIKIIQYLYDYPKKDEFDILNIFVKNMNRKSMCDIIKKLLTFEDESMTKYEDKKFNLLEKIFDELNICEEKDKCDCICDALYLIMNDSKFFDLFMTKNNLLQKIYNILFTSVKNKNTKKIISILQLLIKINENILQHYEVHYTENQLNNNDANEFLYGSNFQKDKSISSQHDSSEVLKNCLNTLFAILEKDEFNFLSEIENMKYLENDEFMATYMEKQKKIGLLKIKQTEYISTLIDIFVNSNGAKYYEDKLDKLINIANDKGIFWNLHDLFFLYPHSNLFQCLYKRIIEIVINENSPKSLLDAFFFEKNNNKRNLIELYINKEISNDMKLNHPLTNMYTMNPCFAFINSILYNIYSSRNSELRKILEENNDIYAFMEIMVEEFEGFFQYKLLYQDPLDALCSNVTKKEESSPFGKKNIYEIFEENCQIYQKYKNGEDYQELLNEKKKRNEKDNEDVVSEKMIENENDNDNNPIHYIDDLDAEIDDENPLFKVEKINLEKDKENFLAMLNKPTEEVNKEKNNEEINYNEDNIYHGRFKIDDLDEEDEKEKEDNINNIQEFNYESGKLNDDSTPDLDKNQIHHVEYNLNNNNNLNNDNENKKEEQKDELKDEKENEGKE